MSLVAEAAGWALVHFLWEGAIVAALLWAVLVVARGARLRYAAACGALLMMVVCFAVTLIYSWPEAGSNGGAPVLIGPPAMDWRNRVLSGSNSWFELREIIPWLTAVWMSGVFCFYARYAAAALSTRRLRRRGVFPASEHWQKVARRLAGELKVAQRVVVLESMLAETPMVLGHFRPVILAPLGFLTGMPGDQVEAILLHELAHIGRSDFVMNVLQRPAEGLLFYHPAIWWVSRVMRREREHCCDDKVVGITGDAYRYAVALTALEQGRSGKRGAASVPAVAATGGNLVKRIERLLYPGRGKGAWAPALAALTLMATATVSLAAWHAMPNAGREPALSEQNLDSRRWETWLNEEVVYLISEREKTAFEHLTTDAERAHFVEQFWARRDPTPGTPENEFKEEHYRRIAYANTHWGGAHEAGWQTDRGRVFIVYGPPDEIDSHPTGGRSMHPYEDWRYTHFAGTGRLDVEFVDVASSGEYRVTLDPKEKLMNR